MRKTFVIVSFALAGWRFYQKDFETAHGADVQAPADFTGAYLEREPKNPKDPDAVLVLIGAGLKLGYVPARIAPLISNLLKHGYDLTLRCIDVTPTEVYFEVAMPSLLPASVSK